MSEPDAPRLTLAAFLSQAPIAVAACDATGTLRMMSPTMERLLGRSFRPVGSDVWAATYSVYDAEGLVLVAPEDVPLARALRGEVVADELVTVRPPDGSLLYLRCNAAPIRDGDEIIGAVGLVQDATAEQLAARQETRLRDRLVETINHEVRTPLSKIVGYAELLQDARDELPPHARRAADMITAAADELADLADVISGLGDLEARTRLSLAVDDLAGVVEAAVERAAPLALARRVRLVREVSGPVMAQLDRAQVLKAMSVLLENALTYSPAGSEVLVRLESDDHLLHLSVHDAGTGIPAAERARVLEPFERGDHPDQPLSGRGLGLAIASTVAAAHGGELELEDSELGGLRATLRLPPYGPARAPASQSHPEADPSR